MMQRGLLLLGLMVLAACQTAVSPPTPSPSPPPPLPFALMGEEPVVSQFTSPAYGIQAFMWWKADVAQRDLRLIKEMGFGWVKQEFSWREIEGIKKGERDWYRPDLIVDMVEEAGLNLVVRLDRQPFWAEVDQLDLHENAPPANFQDFGDFCGALAERYQGRIAAYQVWNEPNLHREWGNKPPNPAEYTELLKVCYQAIKAARVNPIMNLRTE